MQDIITPNDNSDKTATFKVDLPNPSAELDASLNDSDKTFTVPSGEIWEILSIRVEYISTATAGNRKIIFQVKDDSSNTLFYTFSGISHTASNSRFYHFFPNAPFQTAFIDTNKLMSPIPRLLLPPGYLITIKDKDAVDAAADDMIISMLINKTKI